MRRCSWCSGNLKYIDYHDKEWGLITDLSDRYLLEMLIAISQVITDRNISLTIGRNILIIQLILS